MIYIEINYDHVSFSHARTAIISVPEIKGAVYIDEYFNHAKERLFNYLAKEYHINKDIIFIHGWKYHGNSFDIVLQEVT